MKAVIFDMDGVLIDSEYLWKKAEEEIFSSLGVVMNSELCGLTKTMTTDEVTKFWYNRNPWQGKTFKEVEQMVISRVIDLIASEDCEIRGIKTFIEKLKTTGLKVGLATNSPYQIIDTVLMKTQTATLFDSVSSAEMEERGKPAPDIYLTASKKLGVEPCSCVVIEDSYSGMTAAKRAGMKVIVFTNNNKNEFVHIADHRIDSFDHENLMVFESLVSGNEVS
ncbi:MAG TPA: hexitol phosphatase HxpB [Bacteroidales bacterium]|nr:MAG: HAD family hydrolase [Bacteroidetes bacterium GWE2_42_24]OFY28125.1 MAG: HAD family hydrolase [Bacteroidetes bacterium GWF2_43_11]PKP24053.1 MAG: HAD family hydrolase [Bacteroidetes bacterium HGW-Bacteroidetes-22]HAQ64557.1 hexitol phosphatase HxpB [Bacteroidales bacterium]HBZ65505.1 hexitol phosphatase HxpB [Bacteroidales bacterium]